ncbi:MAG: hypothetical protein JST39_20770, partial [Bacteroidetes bacterium]|nr:hypothetical protein [Bacteroidota bacterium]
NKKDNYKVEYHDGELYINGKQQPADIRDKYKSYFKKDDVRIQKDKEDNDRDSDEDEDGAVYI